MRFRPGNNDSWYSIPRSHNPDKDIEYWVNGLGEYSVNYDIMFNKHIAKYSKLLNYYKYLNGLRYKTILREEPLFLGNKGLETILYKK